MITARVVGARETAVAFTGMANRADAFTSKAVKAHGIKYRNAVRQRASGRPGPNIITKKYWHSIRMRTISLGTVAVGTDAPQGHRLENGFIGVDSAGRSVDAPAYPHFEPDLLLIAESLQRSLASVLGPEGSGVSVRGASLNTVSFT